VKTYLSWNTAHGHSSQYRSVCKSCEGWRKKGAFFLLRGWWRQERVTKCKGIYDMAWQATIAQWVSVMVLCLCDTTRLFWGKRQSHFTLNYQNVFTSCFVVPCKRLKLGFCCYCVKCHNLNWRHIISFKSGLKLYWFSSMIKKMASGRVADNV
jgi:hypothetical protein